MRRLPLLLAGFVLVALAGCSSSTFKKDLTLPKGAPYLEVEFKAPKSDRTVSVSVKDSKAALRLYVVLADDKDEAINALVKGRVPRRTLAASDNGTDLSAEAKVPGGKPFVVILRPVNPPEEDIKDVKVEVTGY